MRKLTFLLLIGMILSLSFCKQEEECKPSNDFIYFQVSETGTNKIHNDSYILPIAKSDTSNLRIARALINEFENTTTRIIVGKIKKGKTPCDFLNKDLVGGKIWSWHVSEFNGFAELSTEVCDAWPTYIENNLDTWMSELDGDICFWGYRYKGNTTLKIKNRHYHALLFYISFLLFFL